MRETTRWFWWPRRPRPFHQAFWFEDGINFLLRQAVVVGCTALESFFWDALRENVLTIVRASKRGADESLRKLTLSLDDYLSLEGYDDPDVRLQQIILKNFERGTLYDASSIENIAKILTVRDFWAQDRSQNRQSGQGDQTAYRRNHPKAKPDRPPGRPA